MDSIRTSIYNGAVAASLGSFSFRTVTVTGTLLGVGGSPVIGATISAQLLGAQDVLFLGNGTLIDTTPVTTTTSGTGTWSLSLVAPNDLSPYGLQYAITAPSFLVYTTSFWYSTVSVPLTSIASSSATPTSTTALIYEYLITPSGDPISNAPVTCKISQNCVDTANNVTILAGSTLTTTTDLTGYYSFPVIPTSSLSPAGAYYLIYENKSVQPKTLSVPAVGGAVNTLLITPVPSGTTSVSPTTIIADLVEAATWDTLTPLSSIINNLDRIRYVLSQYVGGAPWDTVVQFLELSPPSPQTGFLAITGSVTAQGGITSGGNLQVEGSAIITGDITLEGNIVGTPFLNVGTVPVGSYAIYSTPYGRQTLGVLGIFA